MATNHSQEVQQINQDEGYEKWNKGYKTSSDKVITHNKYGIYSNADFFNIVKNDVRGYLKQHIFEHYIRTAKDDLAVDYVL